jgi:hypothetical protein
MEMAIAIAIATLINLGKTTTTIVTPPETRLTARKVTEKDINKTIHSSNPL